jgi:hypothetical protein
MKFSPFLDADPLTHLNPDPQYSRPEHKQKQVISEKCRCLNGLGHARSIFFVLKTYKIKYVSFECVLLVNKFVGVFLVKKIKYIVFACFRTHRPQFIGIKTRPRSTSLDLLQILFTVSSLCIGKRIQLSNYPYTKCI